MYQSKPIEIQLPASKSISNRMLVLSFLSKNKIQLNNLSDAQDTLLMQRALAFISLSKGGIVDCCDAGTVYRFLTSVLAVQPGQWELQGSDRMLERPIAPLVEALHGLGADIQYSGNQGFPPLSIRGKTLTGGEIKINPSLSSQYISSLMMLGPFLPEGLTLDCPLRNQVSIPYIKMTASLLTSIGCPVYLEEERIYIPPTINDDKLVYTVENDWSAASYFYEMMALQPTLTLLLKGLTKDSIQGDAIVYKWFEGLGVKSAFLAEGVLLTHTGCVVDSFRQDFCHHPDLAPTFAVCCAALQIPALLTGLSSLKIKETDRIQALSVELEKLGVQVESEEDSLRLFPSGIVPKQTIKTYKDHRMAMAFAPLQLIKEDIVPDDRKVVDKSFPRFWEEFSKIKQQQEK